MEQARLGFFSGRAGRPYAAALQPLRVSGRSFGTLLRTLPKIAAKKFPRNLLSQHVHSPRKTDR
jgi:hypothetical protein